MRTAQVKQILESIRKVNVAVYGDFCLDAYWILSPQGGEISVETGLRVQAIRKHYYKPGGASNVAANLAALKPASIRALGVVGDDIFGNELLGQLKALGVDTGTMVVQKENYDTMTFSKRYLEDQEQPRIDFGVFNKRSAETDNAILAHLRDALLNCDAVIFNQQVPGSISDEFIQKSNQLFDQFSNKIILLDSRNYGDKLKNVYRKTNDVEAAKLDGAGVNAGDIITLDNARKYAQKLYDESKKPVFLSRGARGILVADDEGLHEIPGIQILKKIDTVGAGDTAVSALCVSLAAGLKPADAAEFANYAAAVTVQKLFQTGTASPEEITRLCQDANFIYQPTLAEDIRQAKYIDDTEMEICYPAEDIPLGDIKHAIFDNDGTVSVLRQGWEQIMEPVMIKAVMGPQYETADETLYHKVRTRVRDYIDKSTGIQTILQMEALVEMVTEFGLVPEHKILDKFGYKQVYNDALMEMVNRRIAKLQNGRLDISDYTIKGAIELLEALRKRGIKLYLASGTDREDVVNEAKILGYADFFNGGIYGSISDVSKYSKRLVIENIIKEHNLHGSELAVFGDGPVEIRESRKREGIAVGIASDEVRRYGLNKEKRSRLIKAGAHIIVPDFSQHGRLIEFLFAESQRHC